MYMIGSNFQEYMKIKYTTTQLEMNLWRDLTKLKPIKSIFSLSNKTNIFILTDRQVDNRILVVDYLEKK